jgi:hypothetical protein
MMSNKFISSVSLKFHLNTENREKYKGHWIRNHVKKALSLFLHRSLTKGNTKEKKGIVKQNMQAVQIAC